MGRHIRLLFVGIANALLVGVIAADASAQDAVSRWQIPLATVDEAGNIG